MPVLRKGEKNDKEKGTNRTKSWRGGKQERRNTDTANDLSVDAFNRADIYPRETRVQPRPTGQRFEKRHRFTLTSGVGRFVLQDPIRRGPRWATE
ncbi:hypothetical protein PAAG_11295 [Paracoccidioides lutzii Pb01]|uniref:Uncharacterized protein n=1 Tax=Paracoccidioides lutzii (strain ATCC MYA-826 / Pb01) TaxID=502779 RepID=A0A0A2V709_PARBA|nr:hypothetical protein PAAG_11295 [Paracoccidioides lutzii Pb01]KGQ01905.1 hypothetical protein PAAG_11295 [Paracoccidioides lutzii Pb01]